MRWPLAGIGCLIAGLATGAAGRWAISAREAGRAHEESGTGAVDAEGRKASDAAKADALAEFSRGAGDGPRLPTEKLQRFSGLEYLERLARWLPEATAEELAAVIQAPDDPDRDLSAEAAIFLRWAELDPQGAVRFARNRGNAAPAWEAWAQVDSEAALAAAEKNTRSPDLAHVLAGIASVDPEKARRLGETYPAAFHSAAVAEALSEKVVRDDPRAAAELACSAGPFEQAHKILGRWADTDPEAVLEWSRSRPSGERAEALIAVFSRWAESAPEKIPAALNELPPGHFRTDFLADHVNRLGRTDPQAALDFASQVKNAPRASLMDMPLRQLAATDPQRALAALAQVDAGDWSGRGSFSGTFRTLGEAMGAGAMEWLASPQGATARAGNPEAQQRVFGGWMATAPDAATGWLAAQSPESRPPGCVRAAVSLLASDQQAEYEAARQWAITLPEGADRTSAFKEVFDRWSLTDPDAAATALENTPISDSDRLRLRATIEKRKTTP